MTSAPQEISPYPANTGQGNGEVDIAEVLGVLLDGRWLIVAAASFGFIFGLLYAFAATPIYRADALIQVEEKSAGLGDLDASTLFEGDTSVNAEIEILRSRLVLGKVVDNLNLDIRAVPEYFPIFGASLARRAGPEERLRIRVDSLDVPEYLAGEDLLLVAGSDNSFELLDPTEEKLLDGTVGELATGETADGKLSIFVSELQASSGDHFSISKRSRLRAIESVLPSLSIREKGKGSGILLISLEGADPKAVSQRLNEIANVYVRKNVERKSAEAEQTLDFLDEQLPMVKQDMETAEVALNTYRLEKGSVDLPLETQGILEAMVAAESQINELKQERERVMQGFTPAHPMVIALDRQIERLNAEKLRLDTQVRELPNTQQEVLRLVRDADVSTQLYTSLLNTAQELRVVKAGTVGNVRVVDFAVVPYRSVKPRSVLIVLVSLFIGGFVGVAAAFLRKIILGGVEDPGRIEKQLNMPVYATILHSKRQDRLYGRLSNGSDKCRTLAVDSPDDIAIESLRNLRTALHFVTMEAKNNAIMIAGPGPSIGKSFVSVNLAAVLANNNKKVLLVDGDMRRGRLHEYLGLSRKDGLSDFISGEISIDEALHATPVEGLTLVPTGSVPPNPAELLLHQRFANFLNVVTTRFDHIIIDSPPILAVTDATIIGQLAGTTLMVLKSGLHPMREIELATQRLRQSGVNLRGFVMNDLTLKGQRYGAGKYVYQYVYEKN